jgi:hypothetical protein
MPMLQLRDAISEAFDTNALQLPLRLVTTGRLCETRFQCCSVRCPQRKTGSKPELKCLAVTDVSQRLLIGRAKELIAQPEPTT